MRIEIAVETGQGIIVRQADFILKDGESAKDSEMFFKGAQQVARQIRDMIRSAEPIESTESDG